MEELVQRLQHFETQLRPQRTVTERQQDQLLHQQISFEADRAARVPVTPPVQNAGGQLVHLRVGNKHATVHFGCG